MFNWVKLLRKQQILLLYIQSYHRPIVLAPYPQRSTIYYKLFQKLKQQSNKQNAISLSQIHQLNQNIQPIQQQQPTQQPKQSQPQKQKQTKQQKSQKTDLQKYTKLYLDKQGNIKQSKQYENMLTPIGIISQQIGNRKIVGVQQKWQWRLSVIIKFFIYFFTALGFRILYYSSRMQNRGKDRYFGAK